MQDFLKGGILQLDTGCDAAPALKKSRGGGGGGGGVGLEHFSFLTKKKKLSQFPRHGVGVSSYMTNLFNAKWATTTKKLFPDPKGVF